MGILRVYLALCVIAAHTDSVFPWKMLDGRQAVQIFYIISGFYMAMVLSSRYASPRDFYLSRLIRIFPPYWIAVLGTVAVSALAGLFLHKWLLLAPYVTHPSDHNGPAGISLAVISNLTVIGQDWVMFLSQEPGQPLHFTPDFWSDGDPLYRYLLIPQCWSVGLELTFYFLAPWLNRMRSWWLALIALVALGARLYCYRQFGLAHDPWDYRFFPFEISLFLLGMLGYRLYAHTAAYHPSPRFRCVTRSRYLIGVAVLLFLLYLQVLAVDFVSRFAGKETAPLFFYPLWAVAVPVLFFVFGKQGQDRMVGELSYPIYLVHFTIILSIHPLLSHFANGRGIGATAAVLSIIVAAIMYRWVIAPLDRARHLLAHARTTVALPQTSP